MLNIRFIQLKTMSRFIYTRRSIDQFKANTINSVSVTIFNSGENVKSKRMKKPYKQKRI